MIGRLTWRLEIGSGAVGCLRQGDAHVDSGLVGPEPAAPSGHAQMQTRLPARSASTQAPGGTRIVDDAAACRERSRQACLDVLPGNGHVDVHRVPQWLGLVEILHPDRRSMAEWIEGVVVGHPGVPKHSPPEANIDGLGVRRDGELDLLCAGAIRDGSMLSRDGRDRSSKFDVSRLQLPNAARQPHGQLVIGNGYQHTRAFDASHLRDRFSKPCRIAE
jgi:hypothetical protein